MKIKMLKSVFSFALALIVGSAVGLGNSRELRPQCAWDSIREMQ